MGPLRPREISNLTMRKEECLCRIIRLFDLASNDEGCLIFNGIYIMMMGHYILWWCSVDRAILES